MSSSRANSKKVPWPQAPLHKLSGQYPWRSAGWFERTAGAAQVKTIHSLKLDKVKVYDEYEPALDW